MANSKMQKSQAIAVIGAGHGGLAMAGHLALMGHKVNLYNRSEERLWGVKSSGTIEVTGSVFLLRWLFIEIIFDKKTIDRKVKGDIGQSFLLQQVGPVHPGENIPADFMQQFMQDNK